MIESNVGTEIAHGMTRDRVLCSQPQGRPPTRPCTEQASLSPVDGQAGVAEHGVEKMDARSSAASIGRNGVEAEPRRVPAASSPRPALELREGRTLKHALQVDRGRQSDSSLGYRTG